MSLRLPAVPASVPRVRLLARDHLRGLVDAEVRSQLEIALGEAVTNVVQHAYPGSAGEVEIEIVPKVSAIEVVVRDQGVGIGAGGATGEPGFGLRMMRAMARRLDLSGESEGGTEVRMSFPGLARE